MLTTIRVGVYDWAHFATDDGYYPDDLPEEWRLSYYANEFETACISLTPQVLQSIDEPEWLEDLAPGFQLYFDTTPAISQKSELLPQLNTFKTVISESAVATRAHFVDVAACCWTPQSQKASAFALMPGNEDIKAYRQWIEQWMEPTIQKDSQHESILWLQGAQARYSTLSEIRSLVELMGY